MGILGVVGTKSTVVSVGTESTLGVFSKKSIVHILGTLGIVLLW